MLVKMGEWPGQRRGVLSSDPHVGRARQTLTCPGPLPGWSGSGGLGAKEQGIQDPIKGGDVRDKWDQYKGVGVALDDPYENYRRNKSYSFIARMKARDECKLWVAGGQRAAGRQAEPSPYATSLRPRLICHTVSTFGARKEEKED